MPRKSPIRVVTFLAAAVDDLTLLHKRDPTAARAVLGALRQLEQGRVTPIPLRSFGKTGDLTDCGKLIVSSDSRAEQRIVVRNVGGNHVEIVEVVVIEDRADDLAYLLAALRLDRLVDPIKRADTQRKIARIIAARRPSPES